MATPVIRDVPRIFLSHACKFDWFIHRAAKWLETQGVRAYVAEWDHQDGTDVNAKTMRELASSDGVIFAWTLSAASSPRVRAEYDQARDADMQRQLWLPKIMVDRPADWGDREYVPIDIRVQKNIFGERYFVEFASEAEVLRRALEFSRRCLSIANEKARTRTV